MVGRVVVLALLAVLARAAVQRGEQRTHTAHRSSSEGPDGVLGFLRGFDKDVRQWPDDIMSEAKVGNTCSRKTKETQCGDKFICKDNKCSHCTISRECPEHSKCETQEDGTKHCVVRDLLAQWNWREVVLTILIILTAMMSAAAGMGGGGVYVPLLLLLGGLSTKEAVPLSQAMIVGGATVNIIMFCGERHPKNPHMPKIDYTVLMMLNPGLAAGVTLGVLAHVMSPQWLIVCILIVTLVLALQKSATKGIQSWKKESADIAAAAAAAANGPPGGGGAVAPADPIKIKLADFRAFAKLARDHRRQAGLIFGCWATFLILNMFKAPQCSVLYWTQLAGMLMICGAFTSAGAATIRNQVADGNAIKEDGQLEWTPTSLWLYPLFSVTAGFLGGFLGIGGGIIMGPLLLELGMTPEANQATTAAFVFLSSSLATIQFVLLGKTMPQYVIWFTSWVIVFTFVGQTGLDYILRRWKRSSLIVLSIAGIILGSLVMMTLIGASDIYADIMRGAYMGFSVHNLCHP